MNQNRRSLQTLLLLCLFVGCSNGNGSGGDSGPTGLPEDLDARQEMRDFVIGISTYAKGITPGFAVITQNGIELITEDGESDGTLHAAYLAAVDGHGQEDLFYGYNKDNRATPSSESSYLREYLDLSRDAGKAILVTDYCWTESKVDDSYDQNQTAGYVSFAADERDLNQIPGYPTPVFNEHSNDVTALGQVQNFLYLIDPEKFDTKADFIAAVAATNYDMLIMDLFFHDGEEFSTSEIAQLKVKSNGGWRMVVAYMSIGEAEDYRYYWQAEWDDSRPDWMDGENPSWPGNYKVRYWDSDWQDIIYGNDDSYLKKILDAGFDGVYLDIIDGFEYYEN